MADLNITVPNGGADLAIDVAQGNEVTLEVAKGNEITLTVDKGNYGASGFSGYSGYSGFSGQSGYSGYSGSGISGYSGTSGYSGYSGASGYSGISGYSGSGISGYSGASGYSGTSGYSGASGLNGVSGASGYSGYSGSGISGYSGYSGINGASSNIFLYQANTASTSGYPNDGHLLWNNATQISATQINISHLTENNEDIEIFLNLLSNTEVFTIQDQNVSENYQTWQINGTPTKNNWGTSTAYLTVPVTLITFSGTGTTNFSNNQKLFLALVSGVSGYSGYSGFSGQQGTSGYSGYSGQQGESGFSGTSGYSGYSGSGISGYSGYSGSGISGYSGYSGAQGASGISGYSGASGISGYSGYSGSGISGYSGYSGSGISGYSGFSGAQGISGFSGYSGLDGQSGFSGISGYSGYSGSGSSFTGGTLSSGLVLAAGTTSLAPLDFQAGTNLTTASAGTMEYDGNTFYASIAASTRGVLPSEQLVVLTSTNTLTSQTAAQPLFDGGGGPTNGAVTLPVGTYQFECVFGLTGLSATSGAFGFTLGGAATKTFAFQSQAQKGASLAGAGTTLSTFSAAANTSIVASNTSTTGHALIKGIIRVTVAGTIIPQISLTQAAAAVVQTNSYFKVSPIGSSTVATVGNWS